MLCSDIKVQEREDNASTIVIMVVIFPSRHWVLKQDFQGSGSTSLCQWEVVKESPILLCLYDFASLIKCLYLEQNLLAFAFVILSPILLGRDRVTGWGPGLTHHKNTEKRDKTEAPR